METKTGPAANEGTTPAENLDISATVMSAIRKQQLENLQRVESSGMAQYYTQYDAVIQFHAAGLAERGCHIGEMNKNTPTEVLTGRKTLIDEQVNKKLMATLDLIITNGGSTLEQRAQMLDHLVDSVYVLLGCAANLGLPFDVGFAIVHGANMQKLMGHGDPIFREDGKVMKPAGWKAPNAALFEACLRSFTIAEKMNPAKRTNLILPEGMVAEDLAKGIASATTPAQNQIPPQE